MNTKTKKLGLSLALATLGVVATCLVAGKQYLGVNASMAVNEYGCPQGCTGEYWISNVKQIIRANPEINGAENVRFNFTYMGTIATGTQRVFADKSSGLTPNEAKANPTLESVAISNIDWHDQEQGKTFKLYDNIQVAATVRLEGKILTLSHLVVYGVNGKVDMNIIPPVHYIN